MGCQSSKTKQIQRGVSNPSAGNTLLTPGSQGLSKPLTETTQATVDPVVTKTTSSHSEGRTDAPRTYRKQSTVSINREEVDVLVTKFICSSKLQSKETLWKVQVGRDVTPLEIGVHVDKSIVSSPEVSVSCDDSILFPNSGERVKEKLFEDFRFRWPFRGTLREGINEPRRFEMRPPVAAGPRQWYPAIITKQRGDGLFEVLVETRDNGTVRQMCFPAVSKDDIREVGSEETLHISEQCLMIEVPKHDPLHAALSLDGHELSTQFFGRLTPAVDRAESVLSFQVSDDRKNISGNVGHSVLEHFLSGEVKSVESDLQRSHRSWTIQVGPFAEHIVKVTRHTWPSKIVTLTIDGEVLVDASAEDLGCAGAAWECKFQFVGEKVMNFDVHETNLDGVLLETRGNVVKREKYSHQCTVFLKDDADFTKAEFVIDDVPFKDLRRKATTYTEDNVSMPLDAFVSIYGPIVPRKINRSAPAGVVEGLMAFANGGGATDSATASAGLTVMRAAASDAARAGVAAAVSAAVSGAEAISAAAIEVSPRVAETAERTAEKASRGLSGLFASCCAANQVEEIVYVETLPVAPNHVEESAKSTVGVEPLGMR